MVVCDNLRVSVGCGFHGEKLAGADGAQLEQGTA